MLLRAMVMVAWLMATLVDDHCSFYEDEGWMLVWHHRYGDAIECARQWYIHKAFRFTDLRLSREVLDWV